MSSRTQQETDRLVAQMDYELAGWNDPAGRLQRALESNELELYAQPIAALQGGPSFPMAELLVRLREEEKALLPPGEFLPVFEQYGMMPRLDRWVVERAVRVLAKGSRVPWFSINLSGHTLNEPAFTEFVGACLAASRLPADILIFELDEADVLRRGDACAVFAAGIKRIGCRVAIDGFGRRAATFAPLKALRADFIKVDGVLTRKLLSGGMAERKIRAIARVAEVSGVGVIAECVEDQDILLRLKALGIGFAQGFGIHQPVPIERIAGG